MMKTTLKFGALPWLMALLTTVALNISPQASAVNDIALEDTAGKMQRLDQYIGQGKWVVLNIWGPGCPPCREEMPDLVRFHDKHVEHDAMVVGIAIDFPGYGYADKTKVIEFAEEYLIDFPLLLSDASISERLGLGMLQGLPTTYIYSPEGEVVGMQVGAITEKILDNFLRKKQRAIK